MEFEAYLEKANQENKRFIRRTVMKLRQFWWLVAASALVGIILAFLIIRYSAKVYSIGAKVMIENSAEGIDPTSFLFGDQLLGSNQEVVNELIIIKSYPIVKKTVLDQAQHVHYYRTTTALERVIEVEPENSPFAVETIGDWDLDSELKFDNPLRVEMSPAGYKVFHGSQLLIDLTEWGELASIGEFGLKLFRNDEFTVEAENLDYFFRVNSVESTVLFYQEQIKASIVEEKSSILNISLEASLTNKEASFLKQMLNNYLESNLQEKNQGASNTIDFINSELASIKDSLKKIEGRLEVFKSRNQISNLESEGQRIFEKLLDLEEEKAQFQLRKKYLDLVGEYLQEENGDKLVTPSSFGIDDPSLNSLTENLLKLETERNLLGPNSKGEIAGQLNARIAELRKSLTSYISNISSSNDIQLGEVNRRMSLIERTIEDLPVSEMALMNIERLHKLSESLYLLLLEKKAEAEITRSSNTPDIKIIEGARKLRRDPVKPNKRIYYGGLLLLGLSLPLAWIVLSVYFDRSIRTKEEITEALDIPFMGYIANASGKSKYSVLEQPKSRLAETFRTLRSNLKYMAKGEGAQVILITSCFPGEGKTFVSSNLALSIASAGRRVLVVGADLRKPQLQNDFDLSNDIGLSNYLAGASERDAVVQNTTQGVDVIVSGPIPPNPLELLDSKKFFDLLTWAREGYDYVIIDTSPFVLVSDSTALFQKTDINLLVLRSGVSRRDNLEILAE
ncbi:MAG: polysaccharide biosynthesis tyrosine autokinase, partial [Cryomorphaceae bacterium]